MHNIELLEKGKVSGRMNRSSRLRYGSEETLESLWSMASTASLHGAFCACSGGGAFAISPLQLEEDILDFLAERYADDPYLSQAFQRRVQMRLDPFVKWLEALIGAADTNAVFAEAMRHDVLNVLRSIASPEGGLVCR